MSINLGFLLYEDSTVCCMSFQSLISLFAASVQVVPGVLLTCPIDPSNILLLQKTKTLHKEISDITDITSHQLHMRMRNDARN